MTGKAVVGASYSSGSGFQPRDQKENLSLLPSNPSSFEHIGLLSFFDYLNNSRPSLQLLSSLIGISQVELQWEMLDA